MEYGIDNKSKYTTLQIRTTLDCKKKSNEKQKKTRTQIPPGGMGRGLKRAYSKNILFIIIGYNISKLKYQKHLGPYTSCNQDLTTLQNF